MSSIAFSSLCNAGGPWGNNPATYTMSQRRKLTYPRLYTQLWRRRETDVFVAVCVTFLVVGEVCQVRYGFSFPAPAHNSVFDDAAAVKQYARRPAPHQNSITVCINNGITQLHRTNYYCEHPQRWWTVFSWSTPTYADAFFWFYNEAGVQIALIAIFSSHYLLPMLSAIAS